jgi:hypothetical protein
LVILFDPCASCGPYTGIQRKGEIMYPSVPH